MDCLSCQALTKRYGSHRALNAVTFSVAPGRITGLLGPNGAGKTTLIKLAAGLLTPDGGTISVCGQAPGPRSKLEAAYLPDRVFLPRQSRVDDVLYLFADFFPDFSAAKAKAMLADLSIEPRMKLSAMSKGTLDKVQLALVMSRAAKLYLLDEPIGGVDPAAREYILSTIIQNYSEEASILLSTHLIGDVENILDDVVMLRGGEVVLSGAADDIRQKEGQSLDAVFREVFKCSAN